MSSGGGAAGGEANGDVGLLGFGRQKRRQDAGAETAKSLADFARPDNARAGREAAFGDSAAGRNNRLLSASYMAIQR